MPSPTPQDLEARANDHRNNGEGLKAVEAYRQAAELYAKASDRQQEANMWHMIGVSYKVENDIDQAISALEKAADMNRKLGNLLNVGRISRDIGIAYAYRKQHDKALVWLERSVDELMDQGDDAELGISEAKVGLHYLEIKDYAQARTWLDRSLVTLRRAFHWFYEMTALLHLATLQQVEQQPSDSITTLQAAMGLIYEASEQDGQKRRLAQINGLLAHAYLSLHNYDEAVRRFKMAQKLLSGMAKNVADVVQEDIRANEFKVRLKAETQ